MALWAALRKIRQVADAAVGLAVQRSSSSASASLQEWQNESGTALASIGPDGSVVAASGATVTMKNDSTAGLVVKRYSSTLNADLQQWCDQSGTKISNVNNAGKLQVNQGVDIYAFFGAAEIALLNGDSTSAFQLWNAGASTYMFKMYDDRIETSAVKFAGQNPQNSLSDFSLKGRKATVGAPTSGTWSANDAIIDSVGSFWLCTSPGTPGSWVSADVAIPPVTLTDAATVATDASAGNVFRVTITADRILGAPTNATDGQRCLWEVTAGSSNCTLTPATGSSGSFAFGSDITGLTIMAAGSTDYVGAIYNSVASRWRIIAYLKGY